MQPATDAVIARLFNEVGAIITDSHIVYASGRHGPSYVNKDALYLHPRAVTVAGRQMARHYDANAVDIVVGPTMGGIILAQWTAWHMTNSRSQGEVLAAFAEEEGAGTAKRRVFRRGYDEQVHGRRVVVVEDLVTTGGSARLVIEAVRALGAQIVGLSVLCNRGGVTADDVGGVPLHALTTIPQDSYPADECPLCRAGVPINTTVGKGRTFLAQRGQ